MSDPTDLNWFNPHLILILLHFSFFASLRPNKMKRKRKPAPIPNRQTGGQTGLEKTHLSAQLGEEDEYHRSECLNVKYLITSCSARRTNTDLRLCCPLSIFYYLSLNIHTNPKQAEKLKFIGLPVALAQRAVPLRREMNSLSHSCSRSLNLPVSFPLHSSLSSPCLARHWKPLKMPTSWCLKTFVNLK